MGWSATMTTTTTTTTTESSTNGSNTPPGAATSAARPGDIRPSTKNHAFTCIQRYCHSSGVPGENLLRLKTIKLKKQKIHFPPPTFCVQHTRLAGWPGCARREVHGKNTSFVSNFAHLSAKAKLRKNTKPAPPTESRQSRVLAD